MEQNINKIISKVKSLKGPFNAFHWFVIHIHVILIEDDLTNVLLKIHVIWHCTVSTWMVVHVHSYVEHYIVPPPTARNLTQITENMNVPGE